MTRPRPATFAAAFAALLATPGGAVAQAGAPLSAVDWLSRSLATPPAAPDPARPGVGAAAGAIRVTPLADPTPDGAGLAPAARRGLPEDFWGASTTDAVAARFAAFPSDALPAARDALLDLATLRFDPPRGGGTPGALLLARVDTALRFGRLDIAAALIERAGPRRPELVRRAFDIALLTGNEDRGCAALAASPGLAPSTSARIFCLARGGDWPAAAVTLDTAAALGQLTPEESALLARFLDAELAEAEPELPPATAPTPLDWRMREAIGARPPTATLPLAFAHADLRQTAGWRARILATERLVAAGALPQARLAEVMAERRPAASGGVWDRVAALQALDAALAGDSDAAIARALPPAWEALAAAGLAVPLAELVAPRLRGPDLAAEMRPLALRIALLAGDTELAADLAPDAALPQDLALALSLARGLPTALPGGTASTQARAVAAAFGATPPPVPQALQRLMDEGRAGEAVLAALATVAEGLGADPQDLASALRVLRMSGFEAAARRAGVQIVLAEGGA